MEENDYRVCLVGRFLTDRSIRVTIMKERMAGIWRPVKEVVIKEASTNLFLFQFFHKKDMESVVKGGPWSFDNHLLIIRNMLMGMPIQNIPLYHVEFWVQVHNIPIGFMTEVVGRHLGNYIGEFVEYDSSNNSSIWGNYMRIRVKVDVRLPLKKERKVRTVGGDWCVVNFKFEKLGIFCFACGCLGHTEQM